MKKVLFVLLLVAVLIGSFVSCKEEPAPAHEHTWDEGSITTPATCGAAGVKTYKCECGETKTESVPATGAHTWGDWEETTPATETTTGVKTATCSVCGQKKTEDIPALSIFVSTFAEFEQAFTDIRAEGETRKVICLTADIDWDATKYDGTTAEKTFTQDMTGLTLNLNGHTISGVAKNAFNLTGDSFTLKNGTITANASNDRYCITINYNGSNASTSNGLKEAAIAATPAAYTEEDEVWAKRIKVENLTATGMLCGYSTMEIKNCTFSAGKYRGLVMQGSSGIVENITVDAPSASSAGFVAHSYGTVLVKGTNSFKGAFAVYSANCPVLIFDSSAVVTCTGASTYAFYLENQGKIDIKAGAELTLIPAEGKKTIYIRTGSMIDIAAGAILKDSTGTAIAKPIPTSLIDDNASKGSKDKDWAGYNVVNTITDNRE